MQQHEKDTLEERIVAYFEGELDPAAGKQLLSEVAKSTESRALFKSHESLNALINAARVPMEVPLEAKRSIAERIPGLIAFIPGLLGGAQALPVLTQTGNSIFGFLAKIPLSTAISVGTSVAVITTAGVVIKNKLDDNAAADRKAKIAVVQNQTANKEDATRYYLAPLPEKDVAVPNVGGASASVASGEGSNPSTGTTHSSGSVPSMATPAERSSRPGVPSATLSSVVDAMDHAPSANAAKSSHTTNRTNSDGLSNNSAKSDIASQTKTTINEREHSTSQNSNAAQLPTTNAPVIKDVAKESATPVTSEVTPLAVANAQPASIPFPKASLLGATSEESQSSIVLHPFIMAESRWLALPAVANNPLRTVGESPVGTFSEANLIFGIDAVLSESLALRFEAGSRKFAQVRALQEQRSGGGNEITKFTYYSRVEVNSALWTTAGLVYSFDIGLPFQLLASADGGVAWMSSGASLMTDLGLSAAFDLSSHFTVKPGVSLGWAWIREAHTQVTDVIKTDGIIEHRELQGTAATLLNSSVGINVGLLFRF